jgi:hypothetical protein
MDRALGELEQSQFPLYTLAFYLDHESAAVSVCADTQPNSERVVASINKYNLKHFLAGVRDGDLGAAALWQANIGRSLSLGDFNAVNLARTELGGVPADTALCLGMVRTIIRNHDRIRRLSADPMRTALAASTLDDEVGLVWSLPSPDG